MDALPCYTAEKNVKLFTQHRVLTESELRSRRDIGLDAYAKMRAIEARTMLMMARREILPAVLRYTGEMAQVGSRMAEFSQSLPRAGVTELTEKLCAGCDRLSREIDRLSEAMDHIPKEGEPLETARYMRDEVMPRMSSLRESADDLETMTDRKVWPFPTYDELLFNV